MKYFNLCILFLILFFQLKSQNVTPYSHEVVKTTVQFGIVGNRNPRDFYDTLKLLKGNLAKFNDSLQSSILVSEYYAYAGQYFVSSSTSTNISTYNRYKSFIDTSNAFVETQVANLSKRSDIAILVKTRNLTELYKLCLVTNGCLDSLSLLKSAYSTINLTKDFKNSKNNKTYFLDLASRLNKKDTVLKILNSFDSSDFEFYNLNLQSGFGIQYIYIVKKYYFNNSTEIEKAKVWLLNDLRAKPTFDKAVLFGNFLDTIQDYDRELFVYDTISSIVLRNKLNLIPDNKPNIQNVDSIRRDILSFFKLRTFYVYDSLLKDKQMAALVLEETYRLDSSNVNLLNMLITYLEQNGYNDKAYFYLKKIKNNKFLFADKCEETNLSDKLSDYETAKIDIRRINDKIGNKKFNSIDLFELSTCYFNIGNYLYSKTILIDIIKNEKASDGLKDTCFMLLSKIAIIRNKLEEAANYPKNIKSISIKKYQTVYNEFYSISCNNRIGNTNLIGSIQKGIKEESDYSNANAKILGSYYFMLGKAHNKGSVERNAAFSNAVKYDAELRCIIPNSDPSCTICETDNSCD